MPLEVTVIVDALSCPESTPFKRFARVLLSQAAFVRRMVFALKKGGGVLVFSGVRCGLQGFLL
jgi:hypothetical protein